MVKGKLKRFRVNRSIPTPIHSRLYYIIPYTIPRIYIVWIVADAVAIVQLRSHEQSQRAG